MQRQHFYEHQASFAKNNFSLFCFDLSFLKQEVGGSGKARELQILLVLHN